MDKSVKTIKMIGPAHPYRGGLAAYNERLARAFQSEGIVVDIETFTVQYPSLLFPGKSQFVDAPSPEGLNIRRTVNSVNPINWWLTGKRIAREKPDILMVRYWLPFMAPCLGTICRLVRKNGHTRVVCLADNIVPHEKRPGDTWLTRYFMRGIDGLVAMSKSVLLDALKFRAQLPHALSPHPLFDNFGEKLPRRQAAQLLGLDPECQYFLFFGFIRDYKGLDLLLNAFADERLRPFKVKLLVAGEFYTSPEPYLQLVQSLGLAEDVILKTDFIPDNEVNRWFSVADLVVQPYKSATQSGVTQIGYHFNTPMLVTNVGGLPEIIAHGRVGYVTEPNATEIAAALADFLENDRKQSFEQNMETEKQKFSWEKMVSAFLEVNKRIKEGTL